ncbi:hypothetical protein C8R43DRAFT_1003924 [Mycena crocata]|nr:hypothetical protein C8R43DRAFT_1003924 [Mycena crocata]
MASLEDFIIAAATPNRMANTAGVSEKLRARLEWTWGLECNSLSRCLLDVDPQLARVLMNDEFILIPHASFVDRAHIRTWGLDHYARRPPIEKLYRGIQSFVYLILPINPSSPAAVQKLVSETPPHLALLTTAAKLIKRWGELPDPDLDVVLGSLSESAQAASSPDFFPGPRYFRTLFSIYLRWSEIEFVPPGFLDGTLVAGSQDSESTITSSTESSTETTSDVGSSASCYHEPHRRLLPAELDDDPRIVGIQTFPSADEDAISCDSHITGVEDPEEYARASKARGDYAPSRKWLKGMKSWVEGTSGVSDEQVLVNDDQIEEDSEEQPRIAATLDLDKPDYLSRRKARTANQT